MKRRALLVVLFAIAVLSCKRTEPTRAGTTIAEQPTSLQEFPAPVRRKSRELYFSHQGVSATASLRVSFDAADAPPTLRNVEIVLERNDGWEVKGACPSAPIKMNDEASTQCSVTFKRIDGCRTLEAESAITIKSTGSVEATRRNEWILAPR